MNERKVGNEMILSQVFIHPMANENCYSFVNLIGFVCVCVHFTICLLSILFYFTFFYRLVVAINWMIPLVFVSSCSHFPPFYYYYYYYLDGPRLLLFSIFYEWS